MEHYASSFKPIVDKIARDNFINITIGEDDVKQELWKKVYEVLPKMGSDWDDNDRFRWIKVVLNNYVKDIKYSESKTPGSSQYSFVDCDISDLLGEELTNVFEKISDHNQEDYMVAKDLHKIISDWASSQNEMIRNFIKERIDTSDEMEKQWEERLKTSPRCKNSRSIPIFSMLKMMGMSEKEYYKKIKTELAAHLMEHGYSV